MIEMMPGYMVAGIACLVVALTVSMIVQHRREQRHQRNWQEIVRKSHEVQREIEQGQPPVGPRHMGNTGRHRRGR